MSRRRPTIRNKTHNLACAPVTTEERCLFVRGLVIYARQAIRAPACKYDSPGVPPGPKEKPGRCHIGLKGRSPPTRLAECGIRT
jgi:hypothetical protein